jgi:hypothetical protein
MARQVEVHMIVLSETDDELGDIEHWIRVAIEDELGWDIDTIEVLNLDD